MFYVASMLNPAATRQTQEVWQWLETNCGLAGIKLTPLPHFSWQAAGEYNLNRVEEAIQQLAEKSSPFSAQATGLGIFTGENPVLFTGLIKTRQLMDFHDLLWRETGQFAQVTNPFYNPGAWIPHITLANRDVNKNNLACAIQDLAFRSLFLDVVVDHLALIYEIDGQIGIKFRYDFIGNRG